MLRGDTEAYIYLLRAVHLPSFSQLSSRNRFHIHFKTEVTEI